MFVICVNYMLVYDYMIILLSRISGCYVIMLCAWFFWVWNLFFGLSYSCLMDICVGLTASSRSHF